MSSSFQSIVIFLLGLIFHGLESSDDFVGLYFHGEPTLYCIVATKCSRAKTSTVGIIIETLGNVIEMLK